MKQQLLIPAAGMGQRLGAQGPKALVPLVGVPLLVRTLQCFAPINLVEGAIIVIPPDWRQAFADTLAQAFPSTQFHLVPGGTERQTSVENGLNALDTDTEVVVVHDAARPFVPIESVRQACTAAEAIGAATVALPCADTIMVANIDESLEQTPPRERLWQCQTPQVFRVRVLRDAHQSARESGHLGTDDATLVRRIGGRVKLIRGTALNFKITTPADYKLAELVVRGKLV